MDRNVQSLLIVEDSAIARRALETLFRVRGWSVRSAATLEEGLSLLDPAPACILLDLMLPDGDGEAILHKVRKGELPTRVIVTTGCSDPSRLEAVKQLTPHALLRKPLDFCKILEQCW